MEIKIGKSARHCLGCAREFVHEEPLFSLVRIEHAELHREDYCGGCWHAERAVGAFSTWNPRFYDPRVAEAEPEESFTPLRRLFYDAVAGEDRLELATAFLAAQLLRRQKVFKLIKESDEGDGEVRITLFNDRIGNRLIEVRDPQFSYRELEEARKRLLGRLQELEAPAPAAAGEADHAPEEDTIHAAG
jgi:hypothetical protein